MIAERVKQFEQQGNVTGETVKMGIDQNAMAHIMNVLTDLYSDRIRAIIREYSTNASDAHVEAGITRPIEVTLPTQLAPALHIKDFGVGLTADDIREVYSQYGNSTKRATNDQNGMLGLGCKSALTYTNQFTVTSSKDGRQVTVLIKRDSDGAGEMLLQADIPFDGPTGTEVIIPATRGDLNEFTEKAEEFFSYWAEDTVLVNGEKPARLEGLELDANLTVVNEGHAHRIVMGNVAYPWTPDVGLGYGYSLVAYVPIGAVNFAPSREALMDTDTTKETQAKIKEQFTAKAADAIQKNIDAAEKPADAIRVMLEWQGMFPRHLRTDKPYTYKGKSIPTGFDNLEATVAPFDPSQISRNSHMKSLDIDYFTKSIFVTNYTLSKFTGTHKKKLNQWAVNEKMTAGDRREAGDEHWRSYVLLEKMPDDRADWLLPEQVIDWEDVNKIKLPRNAPSASSGRIPGSYDCMVKGDFKHGLPADDIDQSNEVFYHAVPYRDAHYTRDAINTFYPNATVVYMASTRVEKFKRLFPQATGVSEALKASYKKWWAKVPAETKLALAMRTSNSYYSRYDTKPEIGYIDPEKVDDPELAKYAKIAKKDLTNVIERRTLYETVFGTLNDNNVKRPDVLSNYPLFSGQTVRNGGAPADHMYLYLNAAYAARTKED